MWQHHAFTLDVHGSLQVFTWNKEHICVQGNVSGNLYCQGKYRSQASYTSKLILMGLKLVDEVKFKMDWI